MSGPGGAVRWIWSGSDADVCAYMDVDLSTDLNAQLPLVAPLLSGHSDVAIGTRLAPGARVIRGPKREIISRCYNLLLHASLGTRFSDAQCGFKAIHEVPVDWIDDPDSRVRVVPTALGDLRGIVRLGTGLARGTIGVRALRGAKLPPPGDGRGGGSGMPRRRLTGQLASFVLIGVASTAVNRRVTFGIHVRADAARHQVRGLIAFGIGLVLTSGALAALHASAPQASRTAELTVLVAANLTAALVRFGLYRSWVFRGCAAAAGPPERGTDLGGAQLRRSGRGWGTGQQFQGVSAGQAQVSVSGQGGGGRTPAAPSAAAACAGCVPRSASGSRGQPPSPPEPRPCPQPPHAAGGAGADHVGQGVRVSGVFSELRNDHGLPGVIQPAGTRPDHVGADERQQPGTSVRRGLPVSGGGAPARPAVQSASRPRQSSRFSAPLASHRSCQLSPGWDSSHPTTVSSPSRRPC